MVEWKLQQMEYNEDLQAMAVFKEIVQLQSTILSLNNAFNQHRGQPGDEEFRLAYRNTTMELLTSLNDFIPRKKAKKTK